MFAFTALALISPAVPPLSWGGTPFWVSNEKTAAHVRTVLESVEIRLSEKDVVFKAKALFKNTGDQPVSGVVHVPVLGEGGEAWFRKTIVTANWGGTPVTAQNGDVDDTVNGATWARAKGFALTLAPGEWKGFDCTYSRPLDKVGEGLAERTVGYELLRQTDTLEQFQIAIKYPKGFVFQMVDTLPTSGWQIGETGAFWQAKNLKPSPIRFTFHFYPGTFERVGGSSLK